MLPYAAADVAANHEAAADVESSAVATADAEARVSCKEAPPPANQQKLRSFDELPYLYNQTSAVRPAADLGRASITITLSASDGSLGRGGSGSGSGGGEKGAGGRGSEGWGQATAAYDGSTTAASWGGWGDGGDAGDGANGQWAWAADSGGKAWVVEDTTTSVREALEPPPTAVGAAAPSPPQSPTADGGGGGVNNERPHGAPLAVATPPKPRFGAIVTSSAPPSMLPGPAAETLAAMALVVFPGDGILARVRRGLVWLLKDRPRHRPMGLAELGLRLAHHPDAGPLWTDPGSRLPKLKELVEGAAAAVPDALIVDRNENGKKQMSVALNVGALRMAALRRAVAAAYSGYDDVSVVRRAAAVALLEAAPPPPSSCHSVVLPALGVAIIQAAGEARQRLVEARGTTFSLAAVLLDRNTPTAAPNVEHWGEKAADPVSYISISTVGTSRVARLETDRLLADAAAGRLGDLSAVQPVEPKAVIPGTAVAGAPSAGVGLQPYRGPTSLTPAAAAAAAAGPPHGAAAASAPFPTFQRPPTGVSHLVKEILRGAIPDGRPEVHAKRCLALMAAASRGGDNSTSETTASSSIAVLPDPPYTLRSSPCGILLRDLGLKPPKGQMRALFDEEPHVFRAGKPSPNYLIELVYEPLLELSVSHPRELAVSVAALLQGRTYAGLRLRTLPTTGTTTSSDAASEAVSEATATATASARSAPSSLPSTARYDGGGGGAATTSATATGLSAGRQHWASSLVPPRGQPPDYYQRLERAMEDRLEGSSVTEFITRARRLVGMALLRRVAGWDGHGPMGLPPHTMSLKDVGTLLRSTMPEAYQSTRQPGIFPVNALVLAQQMPLLFTMDKPPGKPKDWSVRLNITSLELSAGLNPTPPSERDAADVDADANAAAAAAESSGDLHGDGDAYDDVQFGHGFPKAAPPPLPPSAAEVADILAAQPARALAAALAPTVPPDRLPEPKVYVITVPYCAEHVMALSHCLACPQIGLAAKCVGGVPSLVLLYAPAVDSCKPAAAAAAAGSPPPPPYGGVLPATIYILDVSASAAAGSGGAGGGGDMGVALLASVRVLLEDPRVAKVVHGSEQLIPGLENSVGCVINPLLDTRVVSEMVTLLDLSPRTPDQPPKSESGSAPELWPLPSNWQSTLTMKYWDYHSAKIQHASGSDISWLSRPLTDTQLDMLVRAVQHLPELWSALTWLLPRLAQFCSLVWSQMCRSSSAAAGAPGGAGSEGGVGSVNGCW